MKQEDIVLRKCSGASKCTYKNCVGQFPHECAFTKWRVCGTAKIYPTKLKVRCVKVKECK